MYYKKTTVRRKCSKAHPPASSMIPTLIPHEPPRRHTACHIHRPIGYSRHKITTEHKECVSRRHLVGECSCSWRCKPKFRLCIFRCSVTKVSQWAGAPAPRPPGSRWRLPRSSEVLQGSTSDPASRRYLRLRARYLLQFLSTKGPRCCSGQTTRLSLNQPGLIPGGVAAGCSHVGIVPDDAVGRWAFSGISRLHHPFIPAFLHTYLASPSSALKATMLGAAQIAPLHFTDDKFL
ncbi:hypothetical protein PR048_027142 [Dryococelus australis]|uniref:Uncharacterized protein n=1 Tax=Dryococelus australis TaxID=614101 RepID=A0ABQ9GGK3_9NEOP|nr:hypothetical protein PR048_027142 [Dryococelus australis]